MTFGIDGKDSPAVVKKNRCRMTQVLAFFPVDNLAEDSSLRSMTGIEDGLQALLRRKIRISRQEDKKNRCFDEKNLKYKEIGVIYSATPG